MIVSVPLTNEYGDTRTITLELKTPPLPTGSQVVATAERLATDLPPWRGTWKWAGSFQRIPA